MTSAVDVNHWERLSGCVMYTIHTAGIVYVGDLIAGLSMDKVNGVLAMDNSNDGFEVRDPNVGLCTDDSTDETNFLRTDSSDEESVEGLIATESRDDDENENREVNCRQGSKKRVNFLPDGYLVQVREIPARSISSSSQSESDSSSESDESNDSDSSDSDEIESTDVSEPSLLETAEKTTDCTSTSDVRKLISGSQDAAKRSTKQAAATIKPTHVQSPVHNSSLSPTKKRTKHKTSQKHYERVPKKCRTKSETVSSKNKQSINIKTHATHVSNAKQSNSPPVKNEINSKRRLLSRNIKNSPSNKQQTGIGNPPSISSSLSTLPAPTVANKDTTNNTVDRMMQTLSVRQLYTTDDFTFLPQQEANVRFPKIVQNNKNRDSVSQNVKIDSITQNGRIESIIQNGKHESKITSFHTQNVKTQINIGLNHEQQHQLLHPHLPPHLAPHLPSHLPPHLFENSKRYYTWQADRGNIDSSHSTPRIAQLWDGEQPLSSHGYSSHSYPPAS